MHNYDFLDQKSAVFKISLLNNFSNCSSTISIFELKSVKIDAILHKKNRKDLKKWYYEVFKFCMNNLLNHHKHHHFCFIFVKIKF